MGRGGGGGWAGPGAGARGGGAGGGGGRGVFGHFLFILTPPPPPPHTNLCLSNRLCRFEGANLVCGGGREGGGGEGTGITHEPAKFLVWEGKNRLVCRSCVKNSEGGHCE
jgi:hypothetical protein